MSQSAYDLVIEKVGELLAADANNGIQLELPFAANDNHPFDWLDIPFPAGWEASC